MKPKMSDGLDSKSEKGPHIRWAGHTQPRPFNGSYNKLKGVEIDPTRRKRDASSRKGKSNEKQTMSVETQKNYETTQKVSMEIGNSSGILPRDCASSDGRKISPSPSTRSLVQDCPSSEDPLSSCLLSQGRWVIRKFPEVHQRWIWLQNALLISTHHQVLSRGFLWGWSMWWKSLHLRI